MVQEHSHEKQELNWRMEKEGISADNNVTQILNCKVVHTPSFDCYIKLAARLDQRVAATTQ